MLIRILIILMTATFVITNVAQAKIKRYGENYCSNANYSCYKAKRGDTWKGIFPNATERDIVMRVNRMNIKMRPGMIIAIPNNLGKISLIDVAPFPLEIESIGKKQVVVELDKLAWGAYDADGNLVHWGPASGGKGWCRDVGKLCRTATGNYEVVRKQDYNCTSSVFPLPTGGAAMPFCMHYYRGFALHGSFEVPGYNASHGCIRMFIDDARWLNYDFSEYGTKVVVKPYRR